MYNPVYLNLFSENGENPLVSTIKRYNQMPDCNFYLYEILFFLIFTAWFNF